MAGRLKVEWASRAVHDVDRILAFIRKNWSEGHADRFLDQLAAFEELISRWPRGFKRSQKRKSYRLGLVHRHTTAVYKVHKDRIVIITVFDNRSDRVL